MNEIRYHTQAQNSFSTFWGSKQTAVLFLAKVLISNISRSMFTKLQS